MNLCQEILQICFSVILLCLFPQSVCSESTEPCSYPPGRIACKIWNHTNLDCTFRNLACIPPISPGHKTSLELLDLSNNELAVLPENVFSGLNKLQTLDFSENLISTFYEFTFAGLHSLQTLSFYRNRIRSIPDNAFCGLDSLTNLEMTYNLVSFLGDNSFMHLSSLISLDLSSNVISFLCNDTFKGLDKLQNLDLTMNFLDNLPLSPFHDLVSLQTLQMLPLGVISPTLFAGLDHLILLSIPASTEFTTATPFHQLSSLRHLELYMSACSFNESLFTGLWNLEFLEIEIAVQPCAAINFGTLVSLTKS